jgi:hypothetical protein
LVCVPYHVEPRYFTYLVPLLSIALGATGAQLLEVRGPPASRWAARGLAALALGSVLVAGLPQVALLARSPNRTAEGPARDWSGQRAYTTWIESHLPTDARVAAFEPWNFHWQTRRLAVNIPGGGPSAIQRVIEHYAVDHVLLSRSARRRSYRSTKRLLADPPRGWESTPIFESDDCSVHAYHRIETAARAADPD